jgi:hypothetical protein
MKKDDGIGKTWQENLISEELGIGRTWKDRPKAIFPGDVAPLVPPIRSAP